MTPPGPARRLPYLADSVAAAYTAAYLVWAVVHTPGTRVNNAIADAAFYPLGLTVCWFASGNVRAAARAGLEMRTRVAWALLALAALLLWISGNAWAIAAALMGPSATPRWIDVIEYVQLGLMLAACLAFPAQRPAPRTRVRFWLDVALMLVASGALAVAYGIVVAAASAARAWHGLILVEAALDWALFFTLSVGVFHKRDRTTRVVAACLLGASVCTLMGNWLLTTRPVYTPGDVNDVVWFSGWILKAAAARYAWHQYRGRGARDDAAGELHTSALPRVTVATSFALLVYRVFAEPTGTISVFVYAAAAMGTLLVLRQIAALREGRRLFEDQLQREARFRSLVQHSSDIVLVTDGQGRVLYVSPSVGRILGDGAIEIGSTLQQLVPPDEVESLEALLRGGRGQADHLDCRMRTSSGRWRDIEIVSTDLRADPAVRGIVLNGRDVTDRNDVERQLRHAQKLEVVSHLAGGVAHDFNNILTAIRGSTELLLEDVPPGSSAAADLQGIAEAVDRAAAVTAKLLAFSRRQTVDRSVLDLNEVLTGLVPLLRQIVSDRIDVRVDGDPTLWPVKVDRGQIEQVIINLATNARDAMPDGGHLLITTANRTLSSPVTEPAGAAEGDYASVAIRDDGVGMRDDVRLRIFEPFFSTKAPEQGAGLGLAMVHGIVTQSGGYITVDTAEGLGTSFTILLPRSAETPIVAGAATPPPLPRTARRVLLVDDEPGVRTVVRRMLERAGYLVLEAEGGEAALAILDTEPGGVDLLLTDLVMPGMHGLELVSRFLERQPQTPVVCMTGLAGQPGPGEARPFPVVAKPFSSDTLMRAVSAAVGS